MKNLDNFPRGLTGLYLIAIVLFGLAACGSAARPSAEPEPASAVPVTVRKRRRAGFRP
ncbi:MAG: hypothetical protein LBP69_08635 [Treponema sp.]|jgi:hypothetical protein|nr:hypothetical protein [Treponema sp.]